MADFRYELKIPKDRVAVLIGKKGEMKKQIEEKTKSKLTIDSIEGDVFLEGEDGLGLYTATNVIKAIGRGFNPQIAEMLLDNEYAYEQFNLGDEIKTKKKLIRLKGRVIGSEGRSRKVIEDLTECHISVYGKTIGIIGPSEYVPIAKKAIDLLLTGSPHSAVYKWLENQRRKMKRKSITGK